MCIWDWNFIIFATLSHSLILIHLDLIIFDPLVNQQVILFHCKYSSCQNFFYINILTEWKDSNCHILIFRPGHSLSQQRSLRERLRKPLKKWRLLTRSSWLGVKHMKITKLDWRTTLKMGRNPLNGSLHLSLSSIAMINSLIEWKQSP